MSDPEFGELTEAERGLVRMIRNVAEGHDFELRIRGDFGRASDKSPYFVVTWLTKTAGAIQRSGGTFDAALLKLGRAIAVLRLPGFAHLLH